MAAGMLAAADSKDIHKTFPLDSRGHVSIDTYKGSIHVSTWDRNEVDIAVRIEEDGEIFAQSIRRADVHFDASASDVRMTSENQWSFFLDGSAPLYHYTIRMPARCEFENQRLQIRERRSPIWRPTYR